MTKAENVVVNFQGMEGFRSFVYDAHLLEYNQTRCTHWSQLQELHLASMRDDVAEDDQSRAGELLHEGNLVTYRASRINPNILRGNGMNKDQLFARSIVAVMTDPTSVIGAAITANNTSAASSTPRFLKPLEYDVKMLIPPALDVPKFGHKKYVALRETYAEKSAQPALEVDEGSIVVSGIAVAITYDALQYRHPDQKLTASIADGDPLDQQMVDLVKALGMSTQEVPGGRLKGYTKAKRVLRAEKRVGDVLETIENMEGAEQALSNLPVTRISKRSAKQSERANERKNKRETLNDHKNRQETRDWGK